jgi:flagellar hook assembly protein FlgD
MRRFLLPFALGLLALELVSVAGTGAATTPNLGLEFGLAQNHPNPFRATGTTLVRFSLPEDRNVRLDVFDVTGRLVQTLANGPMSAGLHTLAWNGAGRSGSRVPSGVYMYRLVAGRDRAQRKMILMD